MKVFLVISALLIAGSSAYDVAYGPTDYSSFQLHDWKGKEAFSALESILKKATDGANNAAKSVPTPSGYENAPLSGAALPVAGLFGTIGGLDAAGKISLAGNKFVEKFHQDALDNQDKLTFQQKLDNGKAGLAEGIKKAVEGLGLFGKRVTGDTVALPGEILKSTTELLKSKNLVNDLLTLKFLGYPVGRYLQNLGNHVGKISEDVIYRFFWNVAKYGFPVTLALLGEYLTKEQVGFLLSLYNVYGQLHNLPATPSNTLASKFAAFAGEKNVLRPDTELEYYE